MSMVKHEDIAGEILDYLATKPEGEDTQEGIVGWWMKSDKGRRAVIELEDALNLMLAKGELEKVKVKRDTFVYRVRKRPNVGR